jgi:hypothetical protein
MEKRMWKDISGFEGLYRVSDRGVVESKHGGSWRPLKPGRVTKTGHLHVILCKQGVSVGKYVHRLVLEEFCGPCPEGQECRHLNDLPGDNRWPENLVWGTRQQNKDDMVKNGLVVKGEGLPQHKASTAEVIEIRRRYDSGERQRSIRPDYPHLSQPTISDICQRKLWKHVA